MKHFLLIAIGVLILSCTQPPNYNWKFEKNIALDSIAPVGLVVVEDGFWIADSDQNRIVKTDFSGNILELHDSLERPMHLAYHDGTLFFPEYSSDTIRSLRDGKFGVMPIPESPDAPAGVDVAAGVVAVADFYNDRIIFQKDGQNKTFGKKGSEPGALNYPTDVQWLDNKLFVADAYNHRVQVFDANGSLLQVIGEAEKMNASTGLFVNKDMLVVTDFENNRVLTYTQDGILKNILSQHLDKPVDAVIANDKLYVANYKGKSIAVFGF